ncbi:MAG: response regulator [Actinobacteria bacterium]|uniref:Sensory transduction protein RegX3 n=1 Tax=freshwater metagenome TaxID=449393 RepID=A0A6J7NFI5_9ZZZZ|nr:response regulator [Actinomycetota bacterium]MSW90272.1 response regulator [Actinomycetota bacterium]MSX87134.1 response regulator [Actinomycetota bacterium]MSY72741.1 response regulator [Actinomycetota bacterium]
MTVRPAAAGVPHLLVVEDEPSFSDALAVGFAREGFRVTVAADGAAALEEFRRDPPDIVLLDVMLPKLSGLDVCRIMRATSSVPIIMVTARSEEVDAVVGLEVGADDYVTKPYRLRELVARVRANLRRLESRPQGERDLPVEVVRVRGVAVDHARHEVRVDGELVELTRKEFDVLALLLANAGRVVTRDTLINRVWGEDYFGDTKTLDVHVKRLRAKIERSGGEPQRIGTVRGLGYKYEDPNG